MNTLPALFEERMRKLLPEESEAFFAALQTEPPVSIRLNPGKPVPISRLFPDEQIGLPVSWCESAYYLRAAPFSPWILVCIAGLTMYRKPLRCFYIIYSDKYYRLIR